MNRIRLGPAALPLLGCATIGIAFLLMCLLPVFVLDVMKSALERLHLPPAVALLSVIGIVVGSLINVPVHRIARDEDQEQLVLGAFGLGYFVPQYRRFRTQTVIAVNVGGCVIPSLIAIRQMATVLDSDGRTAFLCAAVTAMNVFICYRAARPVEGIGIMMPGLVSPLVAVGFTWLLGVPAIYRPPVAFIAGVLGPLIGADLLHLKDVTRVSMGMLSIGGAGTFDGIVLSGVLAAWLA